MKNHILVCFAYGLLSYAVVGKGSLSDNPFPNLPNIKVNKLTQELTTSPKEKPPKETLVFGQAFSDHMFEVDWTNTEGYSAPRIIPYGDLKISPAASSLHYGLEAFEGMKAYKGVDGKIRLFRPELNVQRLNQGLARLYMQPVDEKAFIALLKKLVLLEKDWIPEGEGFSLYLRPTAISTTETLGVTAASKVKIFCICSPCGPYYQEGFKPVKLLADTEHVRAWPGGMGNKKFGGNYAPGIAPQALAAKKGYQQVLWLFGENHVCTEVGAMNMFFFLKKKGEDAAYELCTSPLSRGDILPGVTRNSALALARGWGEFEVNEREVTMPEIVEAAKEGRLLEAFGTGTAAVVAPVKQIGYMGQDIFLPTGEEIGPVAKRLWDEITAIQYGKIKHPWGVVIG